MSVNDSLRKFWEAIQLVNPIEIFDGNTYISVKFANHLASVSKDIFGVEFTRMKVGEYTSTRIEEESSSIKTARFHYKDYSNYISDYIHDDAYTLEYSNKSNNIMFAPTHSNKLSLYDSWIYSIEKNIVYYVTNDLNEGCNITKFDGDNFVESTFNKSFTVNTTKTIIVNDSQYQQIFDEIYLQNPFGKLLMEEVILSYFDKCSIHAGMELFLQKVISSIIQKLLSNSGFGITNTVNGICEIIDSTQKEFDNKIHNLTEDDILYLVLKYT